MKSVPEPNPRPGWVPKGAVWTGIGWNAPIPQWGLYDDFFDGVLRRDAMAAELEKRGEDGSHERDSLKNALGFSESQMQEVRTAAMREQEQTKWIRQQIDEVAKEYGATIPKDAPPAGPERWKVVPPLPKELGDLEKQREDVIMEVAKDLKATLGPESAARLEKYVTGNANINLVPKPMSCEEIQRRLEIIKKKPWLLQDPRQGNVKAHDGQQVQQ